MFTVLICTHPCKNHHKETETISVTPESSLLSLCNQSLLCCAWLLSHVLLFVTPWTVALQAPLPMGFSRQGYWSGLPCPPPQALANPGTEPRSPALQADCLLSEPQGKPMNAGVGRLSLLQGIFPTQELDPGLLHCGQILYRLSCQGSPSSSYSQSKTIIEMLSITIN